MRKSDVLLKESNSVIFSRDGMTSTQLKILGLALMKLQKTGNIDTSVQVSFQEYKGWTGQIASNYTYFRKQLDKIQKMSIRVEKDEYNWISYNMISSTKGSLNEKGEPVIDIKFNSDMKDLLFPALSGGLYTPIGYAYQCQLKKTYSVKLYRGLKTKYWHLNDETNMAFLDMEIEDLKKWLGIENKYADFKNLKFRVLKVACDEINEKTDIFVSYHPIGRGEHIKKIRFLIQKNLKPNLEAIYLEPIQTGLFDQNEELVKVWNPIRLAKLYEKFKVVKSKEEHKDRLFMADVAIKYEIDISKVDGRWEFQGRSPKEVKPKIVMLQPTQQDVVNDAKKLGYSFPDNWLYSSEDSVFKEIGKAIKFIENKRPKKTELLEEKPISKKSLFEKFQDLIR